MELLVIPLLLLGAVVLALVVGRGRSSRRGHVDDASAHADAERQKFDWFGVGKR